MLYPDIRDCLWSMEGEDIFEDGRRYAKLSEIVQLESTVRSSDKGIKEKKRSWRYLRRKEAGLRERPDMGERRGSSQQCPCARRVVQLHSSSHPGNSSS